MKLIFKLTLTILEVFGVKHRIRISSNVNHFRCKSYVSDKYADFRINADKNADSMFNTENF